MTEFEFDIADRIAKIKSMNELYDLEHKVFISFSGEKCIKCIKSMKN